MEMLRFLHDAQADPALRKAFEAAPDARAVVSVAASRGYDFAAELRMKGQQLAHQLQSLVCPSQLLQEQRQIVLADEFHPGAA